MSVSKEFILAGRAVFTIETPSGHYTFKVNRKEASMKYDEAWFVKMLVGPDNTSDYAYIGKLDPDRAEVFTTTASRITQDSLPMRLLNRILARVWANDHVAYEQHGYKTHHEGTCGRCGRALTVPESIESGIGPECAKKMGIARSSVSLFKEEACL